ncbi:transporter [Candidatus Latescibacterota bacterium]
MKKVTVLALVVIGVIFLSSTVFAYDDLIKNDLGGVGQAGSMWGSIRMLYASAGDMYDADGDKQSLGDDSTDLRVLLKGNYGIMDNLNAFVILPFDKWDMGDAGESGLADIWLGAKYAVLPDHLLNIRGALDLPIGDDENGLGNAGGFGIDVAASTWIRPTDKFGYRGQLGIRYNGEDGDTKWKPGLGFYLEGGAGYQISEPISLFGGLEFMTVGEGQFDGNDADDSGVNWLELKVGCNYKIKEGMGISGQVLYTLMGKNTDAGFGIFLGLNMRISE